MANTHFSIKGAIIKTYWPYIIGITTKPVGIDECGSIGLRTRRRVYEICTRSATLYGAETCALTSRLLDVLHRCDHGMLRYMAEIRWQDGRSSSELVEMCVVEDHSELRQRRLRWFG